MDHCRLGVEYVVEEGKLHRGQLKQVVAAVEQDALSHGFVLRLVHHRHISQEALAEIEHVLGSQQDLLRF
jgi:hypothetical protein